MRLPGQERCPFFQISMVLEGYKAQRFPSGSRHMKVGMQRHIVR